MEYASFVRELRKKSYDSYACPSDTQYEKEFEEQMQALVINFDIDDSKQEQLEYSFTSTPVASDSGVKWKTRRKANSTTIFDETEQLDVPKKKKAIDIVQNRTEDHESQGSFESSEGVSMRFDSSSSSEDIPDLMAWKDLKTYLSTSNNMNSRKEKVQRHKENTYTFEPIQGEDSLLEPSADISSNDSILFATKLLSTPAKRTYD